MSATIKWTPWRLAWTLRTLQQGTLNVGNIAANKANLLALAIAEANSAGKNGTSSTGWACWRAGFGGSNNSALGKSATSGAGLLINVRAVPGYRAPPGSNYNNVSTSTQVTITAAVGDTQFVAGNINGYCAASQGAGGVAVGAVSPSSPTIDGNTLIAACYDTSGPDSGDFQIVLAGLLESNAFTSVGFVDKGSVNELYLTANATVSQISGGWTLFTWASQYSGSPAAGFTATDNYTLTFV